MTEMPPNNTDECHRLQSGSVTDMSLAMVRKKAQSIDSKFQANVPGETLAKDVYTLATAVAQVAVAHDMVETGARFDVAAKAALRTNSHPPEEDLRAKTHDYNLANGAALLRRGAQNKNIRTIQEGLYRIGSSLSAVMDHYGNSSAERMFYNAHLSASAGH